MTIIAPQALFMMNSDFVAERARNLARQSLEDSAQPAARVRWLYLRILNRPAAPVDVDAAISYLDGFRKRRSGEDAETLAWASLARILMGSNEYLYLD
jgi:hypothetical protein